MNFYYRIAKEDLKSSDGTPTCEQPEAKDHDGYLFIDFDTRKNQYVYEFSKLEYVLWNPDDTLTFQLVNKAPHLADIWLLKYNCTEPGAIKLVTRSDRETELSSREVFVDRAKIVTMKLQVQRNQLIHIGLIVKIAPNDGSPCEFLLCDPQVGSGPP